MLWTVSSNGLQTITMLMEIPGLLELRESSVRTIDPFLVLGLVAILGFIAPFFARKMKLPIVVGEILFGVLVGTLLHGFSSFDIVNLDLSSDILELLSTLGFITLMFMIGMENDFDDLRSLSRREKLTILLVIVANFLIAVVPFLVLGLPLLVGLIVGGVSIAVVMPVLRDMGLGRTTFGFKTMLLAQIADIAAIFLLSFSAASVGGLRTVITLLALPVIFLLLFWIMDMVIWYRPQLMSRITNPSDKSELGVRATLAAILIFYVMAQIIGLEAILGAFLCGILFSAIFKEKGAIMEKFLPLGYGFLIPIFFIYQGFDVSLFDLLTPEAGGLLLLLLGVQVLSKAIPLFVARFFKHTWSDIGGSLLLGTNLSVVVAGVKIGEEADILDDNISGILILYGVMSCIVFPLLFKRVFKKHLERYMSGEKDRKS
jgi:CPA2 family monovalent cation:H+ antiporter-2